MTVTPNRRVIGALAVVLALLAGACGDDDSTATGDTTSTTSTTSTPPTTAPSKAKADGSGCAPGAGDLPDGRWYGEVPAADGDGITFDLACWYSGEDAVTAAAEDGEESPPANDYYVRNDSATTRDVPVGADVSVEWYPTGDPNAVETVDYASWVSDRSSRSYQLAVWIEVRGGAVTSIEEQWVP